MSDLIALSAGGGVPPALVLLVVLTTILLAAAILPWPILARWKRRRAGLVAAYATQAGWEYRGSAPELAERFRQPPFGAGFSRRLENVLVGSLDGRSVAAFDYHYYYRGTLGPTSAGSRWYSVLAISLGVQVPDVAVNPAKTRFLAFSAHRDVRTGDPAFDEAFAVATKVPQFALDVLTPEIRTLMLRHPVTAWRFDGDSLLTIFQLVILRSPALDEERLATARQVVARIPPYVWDRLAPGSAH